MFVGNGRLWAIDRHDPNDAVRGHRKFVAHGVGFLSLFLLC